MRFQQTSSTDLRDEKLNYDQDIYFSHDNGEVHCMTLHKIKSGSS